MGNSRNSVLRNAKTRSKNTKLPLKSWKQTSRPSSTAFKSLTRSRTLRKTRTSKPLRTVDWAFSKPFTHMKKNQESLSFKHARMGRANILEHPFAIGLSVGCGQFRLEQ